LADVTAMQVSLVLQQLNELPPRGVLLVPGIVRAFQHRLHVQILNEHRIVLGDKP
jgi:hypothetical protein